MDWNKENEFIAKAPVIFETIDEYVSCASACICVSIFHYKLLADNDESALVKIITQNKVFVIHMTKVHT